MALIDGDPAQLDDPFPYTIYNEIKNHWRQADPIVNLSNPQPGMIVDDSDDDLLYHITGTGPLTYNQIAQGDIMPSGAGGLELLKTVAQDITCWDGLGAGNPYFYIYGWDGGLAALRYLRMGISAAGNALIEAEENIHLIPGTGVVQIVGATDSDLYFTEIATDRAIITYNAGADNFRIATLSENADIRLEPHGTGKVRFGTHAVIGIKTVTGYISIKDEGGAARLVAIVS